MYFSLIVSSSPIPEILSDPAQTIPADVVYEWSLADRVIGYTSIPLFHMVFPTQTSTCAVRVFNLGESWIWGLGFDSRATSVCNIGEFIPKYSPPKLPCMESGYLI